MSQAWGSEPNRADVEPVPLPDRDERRLAQKRIEKRRKLATDVVAYVAVNAFLVVVWAVTGRGYFWPVWVLAGWGVGLLLAIWNTYGDRPVTESDIQAEMRRLQQ